jgi:hypothetical protein
MSGVGASVGGQRSEPRTKSAECLLSLAAAPTFAVMAFLGGIQAGGMPGMACAAAHEASPLTGMVLMYLLMSAFHAVPWLRLITRWRSAAVRPERHSGNAHG